MVQELEMTDEQKVKMYNKLSKKEIIKMLIEANRMLRQTLPLVVYTPQPIVLQPNGTGSPLPEYPITTCGTITVKSDIGNNIYKYN